MGEEIRRLYYFIVTVCGLGLHLQTIISEGELPEWRKWAE